MPRAKKPSPYPNRSDLQLAPSNLPTGQAYGARGGEAASLRALPVLTPTTGGPAVSSPPATAGPPSSPLQAAANQPFAPVGLGEPSQRPGEPVTSGLSTGPGPGPMSLPPVTPTQNGPSPDILLMSKWMPALELLANSPTSTSETRQFYRRVRSQMPPAASSDRAQAASGAVQSAANAQGLAG